MKYFDEKPTIAKRKPHKRTAEKAVKKESVKLIFERFLEAKQKQNLRVTTLNQHIGMYKMIERFHFYNSDKPFYLSDIDTEFITDWVYWMKNVAVKFEGHSHVPKHAQTVGMSDASIEGWIKYLKTFINWCLKEEIMTTNPFNKFEGFMKDSVEIDILSRAELDNLLKVVKSHSNKSFKNFRDYCLLHLLIDSMLRITECLMISPNDIDHVNRTILIRSEHAKSRKARIVPLSNKTYRLLVQLQEENDLFDGEVDDLLFLSLSGRMLGKNNTLRDFKKYAVEAGITKRFYIHLLRHSAATHYLSSSGDVESLRLILGHADLRIVLKYVHMSDTTVTDKHAVSGFFGSENLIQRKRNNKRS